jgi:hypothetical protein
VMSWMLLLITGMRAVPGQLGWIRKGPLVSNRWVKPAVSVLGLDSTGAGSI